jgi:acetyltransferase-like isoleucine patch superfamily enzyme
MMRGSMSAAEEDKYNAERARLKAFWAGDREKPFVMERVKMDCDCTVLLSTFRGRLAVILRYVVLGLAGMIPPSELKAIVLRLAGVRIGRDVVIAPGVVFDPLWPFLIEVADGAVLGMGCRLLAHECTATHFRIGKVKVGRNSVIGAGATVRAGVTIGQRATVGCNSFVNCDVADDETVGGVPARPLKRPGEDA